MMKWVKSVENVLHSNIHIYMLKIPYQLSHDVIGAY